ncbi:MAG: hypothetical protein IJA12_07050 [Oscillospiraceae bacterium]|nr:hypothetical protein [Oscillospiraceae bacterium]
MGFFKKAGELLDAGINWIKGKILNLIKSLTKTLRAVAMIIGIFFGKLVKWMQKVLNYVENHLRQLGITQEIEGTTTYLHKVAGGFEEISYNYTNINNEWRKDTVIKDQIVSPDEIPDDIRAIAESMENDEYRDISSNVSTKVEDNQLELTA